MFDPAFNLPAHVHGDKPEPGPCSVSSDSANRKLQPNSARFAAALSSIYPYDGLPSPSKGVTDKMSVIQQAATGIWRPGPVPANEKSLVFPFLVATKLGTTKYDRRYCGTPRRWSIFVTTIRRPSSYESASHAVASSHRNSRFFNEFFAVKRRIGCCVERGDERRAPDNLRRSAPNAGLGTTTHGGNA